MAQYTVDVYKWGRKGLDMKEKTFSDLREAMNYAYSDDFDVIKIYEDGDLYHQNQKSDIDLIYT